MVFIFQVSPKAFGMNNSVQAQVSNPPPATAEINVVQGSNFSRCIFLLTMRIFCCESLSASDFEN